MPVLDLAQLPQNYHAANLIKARGARLPALAGWNSDHPLIPHQHTGIAWAYAARRGLLCDQVGLGKTATALGLILLCRQRGDAYRTIIICEKATQQQWLAEAKRFTDLRVCAVDGPKSARAALYANPSWEVAITTYPLMLRDYALIRPQITGQHVSVIIFDESGAMRHHDTLTARLGKQLSAGCPRILELDATPVQIDLADMHSLTEVLHMNIFGPRAAFERLHVIRETTRRHVGSRLISHSRVIGVRNMGQFRERIAPFVLRRLHTDREVEAHMPEIVVVEKWFDLLPAQRTAYEKARLGVVADFRAGRRVEFRSHFHHLQYACDTTAYFGQHPSQSVKLDYLVAALRGDLSAEKVVVFSRHKGVLADAAERLAAAGIRAVRFTGDEPGEERERALAAFARPLADKEAAQVILGTTAIERGLNLQTSAYLVALNQLWNPQRMMQLVGRIRRLASAHAHVYIVNLLTRSTLEERMYKLLSERAAVADSVFGEKNELFASLTDEQLFRLIQE